MLSFCCFCSGKFHSPCTEYHELINANRPNLGKIIAIMYKDGKDKQIHETERIRKYVYELEFCKKNYKWRLWVYKQYVNKLFDSRALHTCTSFASCREIRTTMTICAGF